MVWRVPLTKKQEPKLVVAELEDVKIFFCVLQEWTKLRLSLFERLLKLETKLGKLG